MAPPHGSSLEDMSNLRVDSRVVATVGTVARSFIIVWNCSISKHPWNEERQPVVQHNMLVGGNRELTSSVEEPLVLFELRLIGMCHVADSPQLLGPVLVDTKPQNAHSEEEGVLISTRITNGCKEKNVYKMKFQMQQYNLLQNLLTGKRELLAGGGGLASGRPASFLEGNWLAISVSPVLLGNAMKARSPSWNLLMTSVQALKGPYTSPPSIQGVISFSCCRGLLGE